jgi:hypothetical protein
MTVFLLLAGLRLVAVEAIQVYPTLTLKDGRQFSAVEIINYTTGGILVRHAQGATIFRMEVLPEEVIAALHLQGWRTSEPRVSDSVASAVTSDQAGVSPSLADRPAIPESAAAAIAEKRTLHATSAEFREPTELATPAPASQDAATSNLESARPLFSGEGNLSESFGVQTPAISAHRSNYVNLGGRVVVTPPPGGIYLLGDVEIRAYPANLLPGYLEQAKARCDAATRKLLDQANVAANEGRFTDYRSLTGQAHEMAAHYLDNLPVAPFNARSDEFGNFTLHHNLNDLRIVATGRVANALGEWNYQWIGVAPEKEANLTEANATAISPVEMNKAKYAAR